MTIFSNLVCPGCGCLCDDIEVTVENNKITKATIGCSISATKFLNYYKERNITPLIKRNGKLQPTSFNEAVEKVAKMLVKAEYPVIFGWGWTSCEAQRVGVELAEEVGGVIDNTTSFCHGPSILGVQEIGQPTCTLGEVKARADLILYWGCNPEEAHPRHIQRYSIQPKGRFRKERKERRVIVVDVRRTYTARMADLFIQVEPNQDYELISALRMALENEEIEEEKVAGVPVEQIEELADMLMSCKFGVLFFGQGLTASAGKEKNVEAILSLVIDLNKRTKFSIMPMRGLYNVTGACQLLTWQTGYPYAVDFSRGYPRYNPGETSVIDILARGENDATLVVASDPVAHIPKDAVQHLCNNPLAVIDPRISLTGYMADVLIPSAFVGIEVEGTAYRMDCVPLLMKKIVDPPYGVLPDTEILRHILNRVRSLKKCE